MLTTVYSKGIVLPGVELLTVLYQLLDQCPMIAQAINLIGEISSREHELCNSQENLTGNYNSILPTIYIKYL